MCHFFILCSNVEATKWKSLRLNLFLHIYLTFQAHDVNGKAQTCLNTPSGGELGLAIAAHRPLGEVGSLDRWKSFSNGGTAVAEKHLISPSAALHSLSFLSLPCPPSIWEKCQENNKCTKGQRRTNRPFQAFITFAVGYSRGARATVLTFGLFSHRVESHIAVAPNNVRGKDLSGQLACVYCHCARSSYRRIQSTTSATRVGGLCQHGFYKSYIYLLDDDDDDYGDDGEMKANSN